MNLAFCHANIGHGKFPHALIVARETEIMNLLDWETASHPTVFEVFELTLLTVRRRLHLVVTDPETETFLEAWATLCTQLLRAALCGFDSLKRKSLDLSSAALQLALCHLSSKGMP